VLCDMRPKPVNRVREVTSEGNLSEEGDLSNPLLFMLVSICSSKSSMLLLIHSLPSIAQSGIVITIYCCDLHDALL